MSKKLSFWNVVSLVISSQIGSGILILPTNLANYGLFSILGWIISSIGVLSIALVFGKLCYYFPKTGGPHVYVYEAFGKTTAFFIGWTYWIISWISTTAVIISTINYLSPFIGHYDNSTLYLSLEILLILLISTINLKGLHVVGFLELSLSIIKIIPLILIPILSIKHFNITNFYVQDDIQKLNTIQILSQVMSLTLWGFIGIETATTAAESVMNPVKSIPKAIIFGTIFVTFIYITNSITIMGLIPGSELVQSKAPYVDAIKVIFHDNTYVYITIIAVIICINTLNAWVLTSSQISLGLSKDDLFPELFKKTNKYGAPYYSTIISAICIIPLLILTKKFSISNQIKNIIDISVISFVLIYLVCCLAYAVIIIKKKLINYQNILLSTISTAFCIFIILQENIITIIISFSFTILGIPFYMIWHNKKI